MAQFSSTRQCGTTSLLLPIAIGPEGRGIAQWGYNPRMASAGHGSQQHWPTQDIRLVVDTIPALVHTALPDGNLDFFNQPWLEYVGVPMDRLLGWGWTTVIHSDDVAGIVAKWRACLASGEIFEHEARVRRADGEYRWMVHRKVALRDDRGNTIKWYGSSLDIEDMKRAKERVMKNERELQLAIDTVPAAIYTSLPHGPIDFCNRRWLEYTGLSQEDAHRWTETGVVHPEDVARAVDRWSGAMSSGEPLEMELRLRRADGEYRWFWSSVVPLRDENGSVVKWYGSAFDIEDRKRAENELQKALYENKKLKDRLFNENLALKEEIDRSMMFEEIVGASPALRAVLSRVSKVAPTDSTVLLTGETGTGKELIARAIHRRSLRCSRTFVSVNCAAVPRDLIASELFGHEKGAFTGALQRRLGRFELAEGGTIFLDEVGELPAESQIALLRVLQEREFQRMGGNQSIQADVRVIAATNRDLPAAIAAGAFRSDLFYRLNVFPIEIPPLRERQEDIPVLVEYFIDRYARKIGKKILSIHKNSLELLQAYPWPGNIRELQNVIERSVIVCETDSFSVDESWLSQRSIPAEPAGQPLSETLASQEKKLIESVLAETRGRVYGRSGAATKLGIPPSTLDSKIKSLKIDKHKF
jgi:PAS domain S-box-containing protein